MSVKDFFYKQWHKSRSAEPLPYPYYFTVVVVLALIGLADSIYLSLSHYRIYTDIGYSSFCAISKSINCDTVSQSSFSILLNVPVPIWGVLGYVVFSMLLYKAWMQRHRQKDGWSLLQAISLLFCLYSTILAFISTYYVHSYCIMCILSYGVNFLLLFYTWMIRKRFKLPSMPTGLKRDVNIIWHDLAARWCGSIIIVAVLVGVFSFPPYWQLSAELPNTDMTTGITEDGHPWIGAQDPKIEITEYTDYLCFQCRKMHFYLRKLVASHPETIRLIHRHFPMDDTVNPIVTEPFHVGSGRMAILALYAAEQGKFWQMNDILFEAGMKREGLILKNLSKQTGIELLDLRKALSVRNDLKMALAEDIWSGIKLEITGTPAFVIDGKVYVALIPPEIISDALR